MKVRNRLKIYSILLLAIIAPACNGKTKCGIPIPENDSNAPTTQIYIERLDGKQWMVEEITQDTTIEIPEKQRFNIIYSGTDEGGIEYLTLFLSWTQYTGHQPQLVTPLVAPTDYSDMACTHRFRAEKFGWERVRVYRFYAEAEDFRGNAESSPMLVVVHGTPPEPLQIP